MSLVPQTTINFASGEGMSVPCLQKNFCGTMMPCKHYLHTLMLAFPDLPARVAWRYPETLVCGRTVGWRLVALMLFPICMSCLYLSNLLKHDETCVFWYLVGGFFSPCFIHREEYSEVLIGMALATFEKLPPKQQDLVP